MDYICYRRTRTRAYGIYCSHFASRYSVRFSFLSGGSGLCVAGILICVGVTKSLKFCTTFTKWDSRVNFPEATTVIIDSIICKLYVNRIPLYNLNVYYSLLLCKLIHITNIVILHYIVHIPGIISIYAFYESIIKQRGKNILKCVVIFQRYTN